MAGRLTWIAVGLVTTVSAALAGVGADARWLAALGREIVRVGHIPTGVPFAAVPSSGWENAPVLGELAFHGLEVGLGDRGLVLAQVAAVGACLVLVAVDTRRGGVADAPSALVLLLVGVGASPAFVVARAQLFSLALFPLSVLLLRSEARSPSWRIWLLVPIVALWSNLHGAVLIGLAVAASYLLLDRLRGEPATALAVLVLSGAAVLATPALLGTVSYFRGVIRNEAAVRGEGLWAPLSPSKPLDVAFIVVAVPLVIAAIRSRPAVWEIVVLVGLAVASVHASRTGVWFLLFAATPAARWLTSRRAWQVSVSRSFTAVVLASIAALLAVSLTRTQESGAGKRLRETAARAAGGSPILADDIDAEALALEGHRVLISNPLDAFPRSEQRLYLDWLAGRPAGGRELARARAVLVTPGGAAQRRLARDHAFRKAGEDERAVLYVRSSSKS